MDTKSQLTTKVNQLTKEVDAKRAVVLDVKKEVIQAALAGGLSEIHEGFSVYLRGCGRSLAPPDTHEIRMCIMETPRDPQGDNRWPFYSWSNEIDLDIVVSNTHAPKITRLNMSYGGMNSHPYGNKNLPPHQHLEVIGMLHQIHGAVIRFANKVENGEVLFNHLMAKHEEAEAALFEATKELHAQNLLLEDIIKQENETLLSSKFKKMCKTKSKALFEETTSNPNLREIEFISINLEGDNAHFTEKAIRWRALGKTSYRIEQGNSSAAMKKADAETALQSALINEHGAPIASLDEMCDVLRSLGIEDTHHQRNRYQITVPFKVIKELLLTQ